MLLLGAGAVQLLLRQLAQFRVGEHLLGLLLRLLRPQQRVIDRDDGRELLLLAHQAGELLLIGIDGGVRELALDLAQAFFNFLQLFQHHRHSASRRWTFCTKSPSQKS